MSVLIAAAVTDQGRVRDHNEDSHHVDEEGGSFIVADGMGGHAAGEVASSTAVRVVSEAWCAPGVAHRVHEYAESAGADTRRALIEAVKSAVVRAHRAILDHTRNHPMTRGMGTTFTGFLIAGGDAVFAHTGDSRAYLVRDGIAIQLTEDQTVVARLQSVALREQASSDQPASSINVWHGALTSALGIGDEPRVVTFVLPLCSGDRLLLCSDGVHEYFSEKEIGDVMVDSASPARAAHRYVELALEGGGHDNATAVVVKVLEADETQVSPAQREQDERALTTCPLLASLTSPQRLRALRVAHHRDLADGDVLEPFALNDRVAYVVLDGEIDRRGATLGAGDVVYPEALVSGSDAPGRSELPVARGAVRVLVIRQDDFLELTEDDVELGEKLLDAVAKMLRK